MSKHHEDKPPHSSSAGEEPPLPGTSDAAHLEAVVNTVLDGLITIDAQGTIHTFNPAATRIFGYSDKEVMGRNVKFLMPSPYRDEHDSYLANYLLTGEKRVIGIGREVAARRKDGSVFPMELGINEMQIAGARMFVGTIRDISERKESEASIRSYINQLKVSNQKLEATQQALEVRTEWLERSNTELDNFAYIASHDLRAPLRGMENILQWVEDDLGDAVDDKAKQKLRLLSNRIERMNQLLSDILAYSRAGRRDAEPVEVDCAELLHQIVDWITPPSGFNIIYPGEIPKILVSKTLMEQVFVNLISNAIKHHDRTEGTIGIGYKDAALHHEFWVEDDGAGVKEAFHDRVFGMFQTLKSRDAVEGSGIGLAIVKKTVESGGGRVWLRSPVNEDRGFAIHFTIPKTEDVPWI